MNEELQRLYPPPGATASLHGLYLNSGLREQAAAGPLVYTNFISSMDGRIALTQADGHHGIPDTLANRRDWRLFQELAALADVLITTGRYLRDVAQKKAQDTLPLSAAADYSDLRRFRRDHGLSDQPAVAVVSASLDIDVKTLPLDEREVYVVTAAQANSDRRRALERRGVHVIIAGSGTQVEGEQLVTALAAMNHRLMYSIAGPELNHTLIRGRQLHRLFLTQAHCLLGGAAFDTIVIGALFSPPPHLTLQSLYLDTAALAGAGQTYGHYRLTYNPRNGR